MDNHDDMKRHELEIVQRRKKTVLERLDSLDAEKAVLTQELGDLAVTEKTLARLLDVDLPEPSVNRHPKVAFRKKPDGIPTVYIMAATLLREASKDGQAWMEPQEIVRGIRERWWPDAESNDINPTLWRLYKSHKFSKKDGRYGLPLGRPAQKNELSPRGERPLI
jgi:hypothetical protein